MFKHLSLALAACWLLAAAPAGAQAPEPTALGIALEGYPYPHPVRYQLVPIAGDKLGMAYMDVPAAG